jgi:hypothetical protein
VGEEFMKRRTRKQKLKTQKKRIQGKNTGFKVDLGILGKNKKNPVKAKKTGKIYKSYLRADLTKTLVLTMLALALELALWQFVF